MNTPPVDPHHANRWFVLLVIGLAQLMVVLDATIVNIALPSAQEALHFSDENRQWVVTAYALAFGSLLLLGGRLGDLFGRKRMFIIGLFGFSVASVLGGLAGSFGVLVAARALQGAFGAVLAPAALGLLATTFTDPVERAKAFGVFGAIAGSGAAVGLLLGGVLTEYLSWRWCLYVNLALALPAAAFAVAQLHGHVPDARLHLDLPGTLTGSAGLFALVYATAYAERHGWGSSTTMGMFAAAAVLLAAFVAIERRVPHPLLPMRVVLDRTRGGAYAAMGLSGAGMFAVFLFLTFYLQQQMGFSPIRTGFAFLPMVAGIMITAGVISARYVLTVGPRRLVPSGMLLGAVALASLTGIEPEGGSYLVHVLPGLVLLGVGMGMIFAPSINAATGGVGPEDAGVASAMVNTAQQVGGSIGTALLSTLAAAAVSASLAGQASVGANAQAVAAVHGYTTAFWWAAAIFAVGGVIVALVLPTFVPHDQQTEVLAVPH